MFWNLCLLKIKCKNTIPLLGTQSALSYVVSHVVLLYSLDLTTVEISFILLTACKSVS